MIKKFFLGAALALSTLAVAAPTKAQTADFHRPVSADSSTVVHAQVEASTAPAEVVDDLLGPVTSVSTLAGEQPVLPPAQEAETTAAQAPALQQSFVNKPAARSTPVPSTQPALSAPRPVARSAVIRSGAQTTPAQSTRPGPFSNTQPLRAPSLGPRVQSPPKPKLKAVAPAPDKLKVYVRRTAGALEGEQTVGVKFSPGGQLTGLALTVERVTKDGESGYPSGHFEVAWDNPQPAVLAEAALRHKGSDQETKLSAKIRPHQDERLELEPFVKINGAGNIGVGLEVSTTINF